jgi:hypothetical protein
MKFNPGEIAPTTGTYYVVDNYGQRQYTVDLNKGETLPPTQSSKYHYEI